MKKIIILAAIIGSSFTSKAQSFKWTGGVTIEMTDTLITFHNRRKITDFKVTEVTQTKDYKAYDVIHKAQPKQRFMLIPTNKPGKFIIKWFTIDVKNRESVLLMNVKIV